jgi:hypothetical protein
MAETEGCRVTLFHAHAAACALPPLAEQRHLINPSPVQIIKDFAAGKHIKNLHAFCQQGNNWGQFKKIIKKGQPVALKEVREQTRKWMKIKLYNWKYLVSWHGLV